MEQYKGYVYIYDANKKERGENEANHKCEQ